MDDPWPEFLPLFRLQKAQGQDLLTQRSDFQSHLQSERVNYQEHEREAMEKMGTQIKQQVSSKDEVRVFEINYDNLCLCVREGSFEWPGFLIFLIFKQAGDTVSHSSNCQSWTWFGKDIPIHHGDPGNIHLIPYRMLDERIDEQMLSRSLPSLRPLLFIFGWKL